MSGQSNKSDSSYTGSENGESEELSSSLANTPVIDNNSEGSYHQQFESNQKESFFNKKISEENKIQSDASEGNSEDSKSSGLSKQAGLVQKKNSTFNNNLMISSQKELESSSSGSSYDSSECTKFGKANSRLVESVFAHFQEKLDRSHYNKAKKNTQISCDSELFKTVIQIIENSKAIRPFIMPNEVSLKNYEINNRVINIFALKNGDRQRNTIINMLYKYIQLNLIDQFNWHIANISLKELVQVYHLCYHANDLGKVRVNDHTEREKYCISINYNTCYATSGPPDSSYRNKLRNSIKKRVDKLFKSNLLKESQDREVTYVWMFSVDFERDEKSIMAKTYLYKDKHYYITNPKTLQAIEEEYNRNMSESRGNYYNDEIKFSFSDYNQDKTTTVQIANINSYIKQQYIKSNIKEWEAQIAFEDTSSEVCFKDYNAKVFRSEAKEHIENLESCFEDSKSELSEDIKGTDANYTNLDKNCTMLALKLFDITNFNKFESIENIKLTNLKEVTTDIPGDGLSEFAESILKKYTYSQNEKYTSSFHPEIVLFSAFTRFLSNIEENIFDIFSPMWDFFEDTKGLITNFVEIKDKSSEEINRILLFNLNSIWNSWIGVWGIGLRVYEWTDGGWELDFHTWVVNGIGPKIKNKYKVKLFRIQNFFITLCFEITKFYYKYAGIRHSANKHIFMASSKIELETFVSNTDPVEMFKEFNSKNVNYILADKGADPDCEENMLKIISESKEKKVAVCKLLIPESKKYGKELLPLLYPLYILEFEEKNAG